MILSISDYGNIFFTTLTNEDRDDLQKLQNKILRCRLNIADPLDMNTLEMHNMVNVGMVNVRRTINLLTVVHSGVLKHKYKMLNHEVQTRYNDGRNI